MAIAPGWNSLDLTKLTLDDIKEAYRNSGYGIPDIEESKWTGDISRGAHVYSVRFAPLSIPHEGLAAYCAWVYIKEQNGNLYADL